MMWCWNAITCMSNMTPNENKEATMTKEQKATEEKKFEQLFAKCKTIDDTFQVLQLYITWLNCAK